MRKIPTLFVRDVNDRAHVTDEVSPGCEWVLAGEGVATRKYDGTCMMLDEDSEWWARREVKPGKTPPANYVPEQTDEVTGKTSGHELTWHNDAETFGTTGLPRTFADLRELVLALGSQGWEGIVWHHPDGRMAKLKARDFAHD